MEHRGHTPHQIVGMQQRRLSRINSGLTRTGTNILSPTTPALEESQEEHQYDFPTTREGQSRAQSTQRPLSKEEIAQVPTADKPVTEKESNGVMTTAHSTNQTDETGTYPNGYRFPPKHNWKESAAVGAKAFWKFTWTPLGFFIVLYGLNVVAWGAMIFFVLLKAAPAMCHPSCDDFNSARKKWIEYDSQILNALFCVTGFGLIPWRFRDLYFLMQYRIWGNIRGLRALAGINRGWFRLPGSDYLDEHFSPPPNPKAKPLKGDHHPDYPPPPPYSEKEIQDMEDNDAIPLPVWSAPPAPLTGNRAAPTKIWKLDMIIWLYISNTFFQGALCGFMWGWSRGPRPSWGVGLFIVLGFLTGAAAGVIVFKEGKRVKLIEGVPISDEDRRKMHMMDEEARAADLAGRKTDGSGIFKQGWDSNEKAMR